jgi:serine palmitoyltransferase
VLRRARWTGALTREQEIDELVDEWTPEPLVGATTPADEFENEKRPVLVG